VVVRVRADVRVRVRERPPAPAEPGRLDRAERGNPRTRVVEHAHREKPGNSAIAAVVSAASLRLL
jgi:hypothetical protein